MNEPAGNERSTSARPAVSTTAWPARTALLLILLLAAALRWWQPGLIEFKYDEAHITGIALAIARGSYYPLLTGGTSIGIQRPALDAYLLALPLALAHGRIEAALWMTGALGVLAVALTYVLGRRIAGRPAGLLAALYMAANPWLIHFDRKLWGHIQVLFSVALLLLAWEVVVRGRRRAAFGFCVVAALQCLTHVLALVQALSWLGAFAVAPRRWLQRFTLAGAVVTVLLVAPYLAALAGAGAGTGAVAGAGAGPGAALPAAPRLRRSPRCAPGWPKPR